MTTATLTKVGNSMAVLLPKTLRQEAGIEAEMPLNVTSPRKGVVVITSVIDETEDRLSHLKKIEARRAARKSKIQPWPEEATADDLLDAAKESRFHDFTLL